MKVRIALYCLICASCSRGVQSGPSPSDAPSPGHLQSDGQPPVQRKTAEQTGAPGVSNNNTTVDKVFLQTVGVRHGSTNHDTTGVHTFLPPLQPEFSSVKSTVEARARFVDVAGRQVLSSVEEELGKTPADGRIRVVAAEPLAADQWYWLVIPVDDALVIDDPDVQAVGGIWSTHFFTGSAPRIVRAEIPDSTKLSGYVTVTFSEPISLETASATNLIGADGTPISVCFLKGTSCWSGMESWVTEVALVKVTSTQLPSLMTLTLASGVVGSGRTVAASAAFSGQADATGGLRVSIPKADFKPVSGGVKWVDVLPPP